MKSAPSQTNAHKHPVNLILTDRNVEQAQRATKNLSAKVVEQPAEFFRASRTRLEKRSFNKDVVFLHRLKHFKQTGKSARNYTGITGAKHLRDTLLACH
ncbi:hypothetical protein, partial [Zoogloea oleivorans]|uniref:hypothetical protein n=1 Tax=Zoogloea oleivorans TaxID=1552750 RepID=UPI00319DDB94